MDVPLAVVSRLLTLVDSYSMVRNNRLRNLEEDYICNCAQGPNTSKDKPTL